MIPVLGDADQVCEWASFGGAGTIRRCTGLMQERLVHRADAEVWCSEPVK